MNQRIKEILEGKKFSKDYIENNIGLGKDTFNNYQDINYNLPKSFKFMQWLFKTHPNLNPQWFFFGEGPKFIDISKIGKEDHEKRIAELEENLKLIKEELAQRKMEEEEINKLVHKLVKTVEAIAAKKG